MTENTSALFAHTKDWSCHQNKLVCSDSYNLLGCLKRSETFNKIPGYYQDLVSWKNEIKYPDMALFYEKIRIITRGDIWFLERFKTIVNMNLGRYNFYSKRMQIGTTLVGGGSWGGFIYPTK